MAKIRMTGKPLSHQRKVERIARRKARLAAKRGGWRTRARQGNLTPWEIQYLQRKLERTQYALKHNLPPRFIPSFMEAHFKKVGQKQFRAGLFGHTTLYDLRVRTINYLEDVLSKQKAQSVADIILGTKR